MAPIAVGLGSALLVALVLGLIGMRKYLLPKTTIGSNIRTSGASSWSRVKPNSMAGNTDLFAPDGTQLGLAGAGGLAAGAAYNRPGPYNQASFLNTDTVDNQANFFNQDSAAFRQPTVANVTMPPTNQQSTITMNEQFPTNPYATAFMNNEMGNQPDARPSAPTTRELGEKSPSLNGPFSEANPGFGSNPNNLAFTPTENSPFTNPPEQNMAFPNAAASTGFDALGQMAFPNSAPPNRRAVRLTRASTDAMPNMQPQNAAEGSHLPALSESLGMDQIKQYAQRGLTIAPGQNPEGNGFPT